ncbi:MAG: EamA family transporter [Elusimicrobia bacterium]|nr:EamA family transporter [Elusimicrobiota bacterium]
MAIAAGLAYAPPFAYAGLRAAVGGAALLALAAALRQPLLRTGVGWPALVLVALASTTLGFGTMFASQLWSGAGIASVLGNLQPLVVVALAAAFVGERLTRAKAAALAVGVAGVVLVASPVVEAEAGGLLALASSVSLAAGNLLLKRLGQAPRIVVFSAWQLLIGGLPLIALSVLFERNATIAWGPELIGLVAFLALPGAALPYAAWNWLVPRDEVGRLAIFLFLTPVSGVILAGMVYGERRSASAVLGLALILFAAALMVRSGDGQRAARVSPAARHSVEADRPDLGGTEN